MRNYGEQPHVYWGITSVLAACFATLSLVPHPTAQLGAALLFGPARCLQWACYFQFLADEKRYPPHLTGRALGYNNVAIGLIADAMPSLLTFLVASHGWGADKEGRYMALKLICLGLLWFSATFPLFLFRDRHLHATKPSSAARRDSDEVALTFL